MVLTFGPVACSADSVGETVFVDFRDPECTNGSIIELDGESYQAVGHLPQAWKGLDRLRVEVTASTGDRISVEDEAGQTAEFKQIVGDEVTTECNTWPDG